jgi:hypothetical protein
MAKRDEDHIMTGVYIGVGVLAAAGLAYVTWRYLLSEDAKIKVRRAAEDAARKAKRLAEDVAHKSADAARSAAHSAGATVKEAASGAASSVRGRF